MKGNWTLRPAREEDLAAIAVAENAIGPEPVTELNIREWFALVQKNQDCPVEWLVAVDMAAAGSNGGFLGWGYWGQAYWLAKDEREVHVAVPPCSRGRGIGSFILENLERRASRDNPRAIFSRGKGHDQAYVAWARRRGYAIERHRTEGVLDLAEFDATRFRDALEQVRSIGIDIQTLLDDAAEQYYPGMYRVEMETSRDVPFRSEGSTDHSYESWVRDFKDTSAHKLFTVALDGDEVAGFTIVWMPQTEGESAAVAYTGVLKQYRRKGIARALKVASAIEAARGGAPRMRTHNDPDNPPILHLNQEMGFHAVPGPVILKKTLKWALASG